MITDIMTIKKGISRVIWGYVFLYFDLNIGTVSILPAFAGYLLFLSAIPLLQEEERELKLLRTFCIILAVWMAGNWIFSWFSVALDESFSGIIAVASILIELISLYFQFQFLTNLASIAKKHQPEGSDLNKHLLRCRTGQTITLTMIDVILHLKIWFSDMWEYVAVSIAIIYMILGICIIYRLFQLKHCLQESCPS